jgi:AhpD family alkylhydroperoxidase
MSITTEQVLFNVPTREEVGTTNQAIFDKLKGSLGFVPNLYASYAHSDTALNDYLTLQNRKTSLKNKEKEIVNLVVSQVNDCKYCLAAHTALGKMAGFSEDEIISIRKNEIDFDAKYSVLASFVKETVINRGKPSDFSKINLLESGYTKENLIDIILLIGDKTISNFLHGITQIDVDFPVAKEI